MDKDYIQEPVDKAYAQGISRMGQGQPVSGWEWLEAVAKLMMIPAAMKVPYAIPSIKNATNIPYDESRRGFLKAVPAAVGAIALKPSTPGIEQLLQNIPRQAEMFKKTEMLNKEAFRNRQYIPEFLKNLPMVHPRSYLPK